MKEPVLLNFRANEPTKIEMDASDQVVGACLCQQKDGKWHPVAYYSRKMSQAEQNYDIHDKDVAVHTVPPNQVHLIGSMGLDSRLVLAERSVKEWVGVLRDSTCGLLQTVLHTRRGLY